MSNAIASVETFLSADDILSAEDLTVTKVHIPEWKGTVRFRALSAFEAIRFQEGLAGPQRKEAWVKIFALCAVDADGQKLFTTDKMEALRKKSTPVFLRLQKMLMTLNGFTQPDKSWESVQKILTNSGVEPDVIRRVEDAWKVEDEGEDLAKNG